MTSPSEIAPGANSQFAPGADGDFRRRGCAAELVVASRLVELGASVAFPFGSGSHVDVVVWHPVLARVEVKTGGFVYGGGLQVSVRGKKFQAAGSFEPLADFYVINDVRDGGWWVFPATEIPRCGSIRVDTEARRIFREAWHLVLEEL